MRILRFIILTSVFLLSSFVTLKAQVQTEPNVVYGQEKKYEIGGIAVEGVTNYDDYILIGLSGLTVGEMISVPGDEITAAVKRYWKQGLFSSVKIAADSIVDGKVYLKIALAMRPRVSQVNINGVKKSEHDDLMEKMGIVKGNQLTPNMVDKAKIIAQRANAEKLSAENEKKKRESDQKNAQTKKKDAERKRRESSTEKAEEIRREQMKEARRSQERINNSSVVRKPGSVSLKQTDNVRSKVSQKKKKRKQQADDYFGENR